MYSVKYLISNSEEPESHCRSSRINGEAVFLRFYTVPFSSILTHDAWRSNPAGQSTTLN